MRRLRLGHQISFIPPLGLALRTTLVPNPASVAGHPDFNRRSISTHVHVSLHYSSGTWYLNPPPDSPESYSLSHLVP